MNNLKCPTHGKFLSLELPDEKYMKCTKCNHRVRVDDELFKSMYMINSIYINDRANMEHSKEFKKHFRHIKRWIRSKGGRIPL